MGTGWSYMKPLLATREKRILMVVIPLQVSVSDLQSSACCQAWAYLLSLRMISTREADAISLAALLVLLASMLYHLAMLRPALGARKIDGFAVDCGCCAEAAYDINPHLVSSVVHAAVGLQVCAEVAIVVMDENTPVSRAWFTWRDILHLVDIVCCCAVLFPIVWSIKHLREASQVHIGCMSLWNEEHFYVSDVMRPSMMKLWV